MRARFATKLRLNAQRRTPPARPLFSDPTRTGTLREAFMRAMRVRFNRLRAKVVALIGEEDALGLRQRSPTFDPFANAKLVGTVYTANAGRWEFKTDDQKLEAFQEWLAQEMEGEILSSPGESADDWWQKYVEDGYRKGQGRAFDDVKKPASAEDDQKFQGGKEEFLRGSFGRPVAIAKVKLLAGRVFTELKGVTDAMSQKMTRTLTDGMAQGTGAMKLAKRLAADVDGIGINRAMTIARTEIIRAHAEGQLDALEGLGVLELGVMVEWSTAGDPHVCPLCVPLQGIVIKTSEARGILPRHPNCRCAWIPANVGEDTAKQKRGPVQIQKARNDSIQAENPEAELQEQKDKTTWAGADTKISGKRPRSILQDAKPEKITKTKTEVTDTTKETTSTETTTEKKETTVKKRSKKADQEALLKEWENTQIEEAAKSAEFAKKKEAERLKKLEEKGISVEGLKDLINEAKTDEGKPIFFMSDKRAFVEKWLEENSKPVKEPVKAHGMSEPEEMREVVIGGVRFMYNPKYGKGAMADTIVNATYGFDKIPETLFKANERVVISSQKNNKDSYWEKEYKIPGFVSSATGGDGTIVKYNVKAGEDFGMSTDTFAHESGHNLAKKLWDSTHPPATSEYGKAQKKEAPVTSYGSKSTAEDFAEAADLWVTKHKEFKEQFPNKYEAMKDIMEGKVRAPTQEEKDALQLQEALKIARKLLGKE